MGAIAVNLKKLHQTFSGYSSFSCVTQGNSLLQINETAQGNIPIPQLQSNLIKAIWFTNGPRLI